MQLTIVLVLNLYIFGVHCGCYHHYGPALGWQHSKNHHNYHCVQQEDCFDNLYKLDTNQRWLTQNGRCNSFGGFVIGYTCCLHKSTPARSPNVDRRTPTRNPPSRPMTISSPKPNSKQQSLIFQQTFQRPQSPTSTAIAPSQNANCKCILKNRCSDRQINSFQFTQQISCPSPNEICCHNLVPTSSTTITNSSPQSQTQPQGLTRISPSSNSNCNCIPTNECHDDDISSNRAGLIDVQNNNRPLRQESCPNANHVCCHHLVHPLPAPIRNTSPQLQTQKPLQVSPQRPTVNPTPQPQPQKPFQVSSQRPTVSPQPRPQSQSPSQISSPPSSNCLCTPFYKCYDDETSSNLTGVVDDRSFVPVAEQRTCSDPNEICCHNLIKPPTVSSSEDCSGSCVPIQECPNLSNILNEARTGKSDAIQKLRNLVCSIRGERALVCCQQKGVDNTSGVIFRDN